MTTKNINFKIIEDFVSKDLSDKLIKDSEMLNKNDFIKIHGNRLFLSSSSNEFQNIILTSPSWQKLISKINSEEFLNLCCSLLEIDSSKFIKIDFFNKIKQQIIGNKILKNLSTIKVLKYIFIKYFRRLIRNITFSEIFYTKRIPIELLFDYSIAGDGYYNNIHRDSDSRVIVFLLYLNEINSEGGSLNFYVKKKNNDFENIQTISPKAGRLVIFLNEDHSYHGVEIMKKTQNKRHFLYGSFTSLNHKNPYIKNKCIETEFNLYE